MDASTLSFFATQGPWALLFVLLLFWVLRENAKREERLIKCLDDLAPKIDGIVHDLGEIKEQIKV